MTILRPNNKTKNKMNMKKRFLVFAAILSFCGITNASANDYRDMEPLKLAVPEMTPTLVTITNNSYRPELELDEIGRAHV